MLLSLCSGFSLPCPLAVPKNNFRRLLRTVEALSDLGPELTAERDFSQSAQAMLAALMEAAGARGGARIHAAARPLHCAAPSPARSRSNRRTRAGRPERNDLRCVLQFERQRGARVVQVHRAPPRGGETRG